MLTHLGNGIPNLLDRHRNPVWAGLAEDSLTAMLIADGHHLPADVIKVMIRCKSPEKIIIVSDASPATGFAPGHYTVMGNDAILEPNGKLYNPHLQCLVGSASTSSYTESSYDPFSLTLPQFRVPLRHATGANFLFGDGHAGWKKGPYASKSSYHMRLLEPDHASDFW